MGKPTSDSVESRCITERCREDFLDEEVQEGEQLCKMATVRLEWTDDSHAHIHVSKSIRDQSEEYCVDLDWEDITTTNKLEGSCQCRYFERGGNCGHIWAALVELEKHTIAKTIPGVSDLEIVEEELANEFDNDAFDTEDSGFDGESQSGLWEMLPSPRGKQDSGAPAWLAALHDTKSFAVAIETEQPQSNKKQDGNSEILYILAVENRHSSSPAIKFFERRRRKNGKWGVVKALNLNRKLVLNLPNEIDRWLIGYLLSTCEPIDGFYSSYSYYLGMATRGVSLDSWSGNKVWKQLCDTGRFGYSPNGDSNNAQMISWDNGPPWRFEFTVERNERKQSFRLSGKLVRAEQSISVCEPELMLPDGFFILNGRMSCVDGDNLGWPLSCRTKGDIDVPLADADELVQGLFEIPELPTIKLNDLNWDSVQVPPRPRIRFEFIKGNAQLPATVDFEYEGQTIPCDAPNSGIIDEQNRRILVRDRAREKEFLSQLEAAGFRSFASRGRQLDRFMLPTRIFPQVMRQLAQSGWRVETSGREFRTAGDLSLKVSSGIDWFELEANFDFGGVSVGLPKLLEALKQGQEVVVLDDNSCGILPEDWLNRYGMLIQLAQTQGNRFRFGRSQAMLLDALLAAQPHAEVDAKFDEIRSRLRSFEGIQPAQPVASFQGHLREYQSLGLGWLHFLRDFQLGGCLADDMGLGKTVQVLSMLDERRATAAARAPSQKKLSLVVVPKSLVFNWIEESRRFTPQMRILNYTGLDRKQLLERAGDYDLLLTTYGTLRRDIVTFGNLEFDYAILDEAQAVKNANSQAAKACRLIKADHRLAMSGTPIENHLGELWSLFEFLNPGMLGRVSAFKALAGGKTKVDQEPAADRSVLAQALRPFILRRTKQQVLTELPAKTEQTVYCELGDHERKLYNELRDHYRTSLDQRVAELGLKKAKIHVLEALLRLRQAACHPGLLNRSLASESSSKLETLLEQLAEVLDEGHKALVFSQFTSLLALVRKQLDDRGTVYEYLDGKTADRQKCVTRFQSDPECRLFLISLKAGGQGLNLTAADYVFILDPWWNPAVEAQAVDRAHRIGQTKPVIAYRLIARDTVEEKILELQQSKRQLADAIISEDNSVLGKLTAEDLHLLFS